MASEPFVFPGRRHSHLRLAAAVSPGARQPRAQTFPRQVRYPDRAGHGRAIRSEITRVRAEHLASVPILGLNPELVMVLETNRQLSPKDVERAGLTVLELRSDKLLVAFASDPDMTGFLTRIAQYQRGVPGLTEAGNERAAPYQGLFDVIDHVRRLRPGDVLSSTLADRVADASEGERIRVDVLCWCGEDEAEARRRNQDVRDAVEASGGAVPDHGVRVEAGWSTVCADVPAETVLDLAAVDRVRHIDVLPMPILSYPALRATTPDDLPLVLPPAADAPVVAVIDSGIRSAHPLLAPAVVGVEYIGSGSVMAAMTADMGLWSPASPSTGP